jgi:hypothetical protein
MISQKVLLNKENINSKKLLDLIFNKTELKDFIQSLGYITSALKNTIYNNNINHRNSISSFANDTKYDKLTEESTSHANKDFDVVLTTDANNTSRDESRVLLSVILY